MKIYSHMATCIQLQVNIHTSLENANIRIYLVICTLCSTPYLWCLVFNCFIPKYMFLCISLGCILVQAQPFFPFPGMRINQIMLTESKCVINITTIISSQYGSYYVLVLIHSLPYLGNLSHIFSESHRTKVR